MLIIDSDLAESLIEITPTRCMVNAARMLLAATSGPLTSPYECCACGMPAITFDVPCEICGRDNFRPARRTA